MRTRTTVGDVLLDDLRAWGCATSSAVPTWTTGCRRGCGRTTSRLLVEARHEETAAFEAVGYATFSGHAGVCAASSAPGTVRLLRSLHDARPDGAPVVALLGTELARATTDPAGRVGALSDGARTFADGAAGRLPRSGRPVGLRSVPPGCAAHGP